MRLPITLVSLRLALIATIRVETALGALESTVVDDPTEQLREHRKPTFALYAVAVFLLIAIARQNAARIYDILITRLTTLWYGVVIDSFIAFSVASLFFVAAQCRLLRFEDGANVLDVGIGTLSALAPHVARLESKRLFITGIDYEPVYIRAAHVRIQKDHILRARVSVQCASVYDSTVLKQLAAKRGGKFDAAYLSGSLTLMPDPVAALQATAAVVRSGGCIHCTQTYQRRSIPMLATIKPLLKYVTTINFGQLTTEAQALRIFEASGLPIKQHYPISGSVNNMFQAAYHTVLTVPHLDPR